MPKTPAPIAAIAAAIAAATPCAASNMPLDRVAGELALEEIENTTNIVTLADGTNTVVLHPGYRRMSLNGIAVWLNSPAEADFRKTSRLSGSDVTHLLKPILDGIRCGDATNIPPMRVFIDPGHGGEDAGAISTATGQNEKDVVLDISMRLGELLVDSGCEVAFSRTNDTFVTLAGRGELAARENADIFVSIHANTSARGEARGIETYTLAFKGCDSTSGDARIAKKSWPANAFDAKSSYLGFCIHSAVNTERGDADRGLRHARFQVLRQAPCPAILIECGFLSNDAENASLESPRYRQRLAVAIAKGIQAYRASARVAQSPPPAANPEDAPAKKQDGNVGDIVAASTENTAAQAESQDK